MTTTPEEQMASVDANDPATLLGNGDAGPRRRRRVPPLTVMPTLVTLGNLACGFAAIHYASKPIEPTGVWHWSTLTFAATLVFVGMFLDAIDGSLARLTRSFSEVGAQLDSFADLVTFGVAPAFLMLRLVGPQGEIVFLESTAGDTALAKVIWAIAALYVCCAALRLARFNVETPSASVESHLLFRGLPTPGAAGAIASLIILYEHWASSPVQTSEPMSHGVAIALPLIMLLCAIGMVSSIPFVHFTNRFIGGRRSFTYVARIVIPLVLALFWFQETLALAFTVYALSGPVRWLVQIGRRRHAGT